MVVDGLEYVQARWFRKGRLTHDVAWIVTHVMVAPEKPGTAEAVARMFATWDRKASAHVCVDNNSAVRCVPDQDTAYAAAGANTKGFHIELAGYPDQTKDQWLDPYGDGMLARAAIEAARVAKKHQIPLRQVWAPELRAGVRGFTTHAEVEKAFPSTGHWDPGPHFPMAHFLELVAARPFLPASTTANSGAIMIDCVDAIRCPTDGGLQKLQADGGVFTAWGCGHFWGSYPGLPADVRNAPRVARAIVRTEGTGYCIVFNDGSVYDFPASG